MFCRIPCAKDWSELQENIRGRGGSQWIIRTGHVGAGALTRPAMRSIARRWRARLATRTRASGPTWAVVAGRSKGAVTNRKIRPVRRWSGDTVWIETSFTVGHPPGNGKGGPARPGAKRKDNPFPPGRKEMFLTRASCHFIREDLNAVPLSE